MKHCIILDKLRKCAGCEYSVPGPTSLLVINQCTWCERNQYLLTELKDNYMKRPKEVIMSSDSIPNDSDKVKKDNDILLGQWGMSPKSKRGEDTKSDKPSK